MDGLSQEELAVLKAFRNKKSDEAPQQEGKEEIEPIDAKANAETPSKAEKLDGETTDEAEVKQAAEPMVVDNESDYVLNEPSESEAPPPEPVKRKRGRPRKKKVVEQPKPKRKRGRPRKNPLPAVEEEATSAPPIKRKRGRPPKRKTEAESATSTPKRRPGRPRKNPITPVQQQEEAKQSNERQIFSQEAMGTFLQGAVMLINEYYGYTFKLSQ